MYSIVIIEDDHSYRSMMETILQMEGFEVRCAADARSGLALLRERRPHLILCDIMMAGMDGHDLLELLREDPALSGIPFIFVTALSERADVRRGMAAGADDYLLKPFSADELLAAATGRIRRCESLAMPSDGHAFHREQTTLRTKITVREREVLLLVGKGATSRKIAEQLGVSLKTVEVHRANLMNKLAAPNAAGLARWALIAELAQPGS